MNVLLQNAGLWWLAGLLVVPPLLHFFARARPPRFLFSATHLVAKVVRHTMRIKRPRDWLLLVCRTLLCLFLVGVFLRPLLFLGDRPAAGAARSVVVMVDRSASMAWAEGGQSRFAAACAEAAEILGGLSSRDKANVIWLDSEPDAVFPELGPNVGYLRQRLAEVRASNEAGNPDAAIELAASLFKNTEGRRELYIASDFQATQWGDVKAAVPEGIRVQPICPAREDAANGAALSVRTEPMSPLAGEPVQVICEVANFSGEPRTRTVTLEIGVKRVTRRVMLPPWGRGSAVVEHRFRAPGEVVVQAQLDEDAFGVDDWCGGVIRVRDALCVAIHGDDSGTASVWRRAVRALPWARLLPVSPDNLEFDEPCDLLLLAGWTGERAEELGRLRAAGLPVVCSPAPGLDARGMARLAGLDAPVEGAAAKLERLDEAMGMTVSDPEHAAFALFREGEYGDPARASFRERVRLPIEGIPGRALLSFADRVPALYLCDGEPALLFWGASLSPSAGDWPAQTPFLPFFGELVSVLRAQRADSLAASAFPGDTLSFLAPLDADGVRLLDGNDREIPVWEASVGMEGRRFVSGEIRSTGAYRWHIGEEPRAVSIVNYPTVESDLRTGPPPALSGSAAAPVRRAAELQALQKGLPLWDILLWCGLAALVAECGLVLLCDFEARKLAEKGL